MTRCRFVPPYLLQTLARSGADPALVRRCRWTLVIDEQLRARREALAVARPGEPPSAAAPTPGLGGWTVHDAHHGSALPGSPVRSTGEPASGDVAVDEAYDWLAASLETFRQEFGRDSYDGRGAHVSASVHFERAYANAFWDGTQLVFGDGDGEIFERFTKPVDVLAHELTHAVTEHTAGLVYRDQPGALNESMSDVFSAVVKQRLLGQTVDQADWLVGAGLFRPGVQARALRSMSAPGTAYDDPRIGKDPQPASMDGYVHTADDNGGVHINSGIPNRAFYLAATALGGRSWEAAGQVWWAALTSGLAPRTDFAGFAEATIRAARAVSGAAADAVSAAWSAVGVLAAPAGVAPAAPAQPSPGPPVWWVVSVRRTGGLAGLVAEATVLLGDDPRTPEIERLLDRIGAAPPGPAGALHPDRFVYDFLLRGRHVVVPEQLLTPELARLARLLLDD